MSDVQGKPSVIGGDAKPKCVMHAENFNEIVGINELTYL
jgi:hypothetical protein